MKEKGSAGFQPAASGILPDACLSNHDLTQIATGTLQPTRISHGPALHLANHLTSKPFVIPLRITADMRRSFSPLGEQSMTQSESRGRENCVLANHEQPG
jgi:hypothetical protein